MPGEVETKPNGDLEQESKKMKEGMETEKMELKETKGEEIPLTAEVNGEAGEVKVKAKTGGFLGFFTKKEKKEEGKEKEDKTEQDDKEKMEGKADAPEAKTPKVKKEPKPNPIKSWYKERAAKKATEEKAETISFGLDLTNRDETGLNDHVKLAFEDILAEPEGYHSWDCLWKATFRLFHGLRGFLYRLLSLVLAIPAAIVWALVFALLTALNVFCCVPGARAAAIPGFWLGKLWNFLLRSVLDPIFRSAALLCSAVHIRRSQAEPASNPLTISPQNPPPLPTSDLP